MSNFTNAMVNIYILGALLAIAIALVVLIAIKKRE